MVGVVHAAEAGHRANEGADITRRILDHEAAAAIRQEFDVRGAAGVHLDNAVADDDRTAADYSSVPPLTRAPNPTAPESINNNPPGPTLAPLSVPPEKTLSCPPALMMVALAIPPRISIPPLAVPAMLMLSTMVEMASPPADTRSKPPLDTVVFEARPPDSTFSRPKLAPSPSPVSVAEMLVPPELTNSIAPVPTAAAISVPPAKTLTVALVAEALISMPPRKTLIVAPDSTVAAISTTVLLAVPPLSTIWEPAKTAHATAKSPLMPVVQETACVIVLNPRTSNWVRSSCVRN
jgi:hypothetical protein